MSGSLRFIHFADLHLGVEAGGRIDPATGLNRRVVDVCERLDEVCDVAERDEIHAVLFAGDAFTNQRPAPTLQSLFAKRVRRLRRNGTAVFLLIGNHDLPKMSALAHPFSIYDALEVEGVVVGDRAQVYRLPLSGQAPVLQIAALPHFSRQQVLARIGDAAGEVDRLIEEQVARTVRDLGAAVDPALPAVFCGHCHVNQAELGDQTLFNISDVEISLSTLMSGQPYPYFALGHVHKRQVLSDEPFAAYPGSLERFDFGEGDRIDVARKGSAKLKEAEPKGFFRFDLTLETGSWVLRDTPEFVPVAARRFITVRCGALDRDDPVADLAGRIARASEAGADFDAANVRIMASLDAADRGRLSGKVLRDLVPEASEIRAVLEASDVAAVRDPRFARRMTESEALERYLETREDWSDDRDELLRLGRELIAEVLR